MSVAAGIEPDIFFLSIYRVVIRLDIEFCKDQCPNTAEDVS